MNSTTMEHQIHTEYKDDVEDDTLSLRNLQMYDHTPSSSTRSSPRTSSAHDLFDFFPTLSHYTPTRDIMFFGKLIHEGDNEELNDQYQDRVIRSTSFRLPERPTEKAVPLRSVSNRDLGSPHRRMKTKQRRCVFGPVKFMPEMDMDSIASMKKRQARMFAVAEGGGGGGGGRKAVEVTVRGKNTMSCRERLNSVFEKSFACLRY